MFDARILCSARRALGLAALMSALAGCGQRGPLYLPTDPAAAERATLPEVLVPSIPTHPAPPSTDETPTGRSGTGTANPLHE